MAVASLNLAACLLDAVAVIRVEPLIRLWESSLGTAGWLLGHGVGGSVALTVWRRLAAAAIASKIGRNMEKWMQMDGRVVTAEVAVVVPMVVVVVTDTARRGRIGVSYVQKRGHSGQRPHEVDSYRAGRHSPAGATLQNEKQ